MPFMPLRGRTAKNDVHWASLADRAAGRVMALRRFRICAGKRGRLLQPAAILQNTGSKTSPVHFDRPSQMSRKIR